MTQTCRLDDAATARGWEGPAAGDRRAAALAQAARAARAARRRRLGGLVWAAATFLLGCAALAITCWAVVEQFRRALGLG